MATLIVTEVSSEQRVGRGVGVAGGLLGWLTSLSPPLSRQFMASSGLAAMGTAALASQWSS